MELGLSTLEENHKRGDMGEMYKVDFKQWFNLAAVRQGAGNARGTKGYLNVEEPPWLLVMSESISYLSDVHVSGILSLTQSRWHVL